MSSLDIKTFISKIHPFDKLGANAIGDLCQKADVLYLAQNETFFKKGDVSECFYIVAKGVIKEEGESEFYYSAGDFFDFEALLSGTYKSSYSVVEEALLYLFSKEDFLSAVHSNTAIENYFFLSAAKKLEEKYKNSDSYLVKRISDIAYEAPVFVDESDTIYNAVTKMTKEGKTFILVKFGDEIGIVTDSDLRKKVLLTRLSLDNQIGEIATKNIKTVEKSDFLFNALLLMTKHNIKRVVLTDGTEICGVLQDIDILGALSSNTQFVARKIEGAKNIDELKSALADIDASIKGLLDEGVKVKHIIKLVSELNVRVFQKAFEWSFAPEIMDDVALVIFGSEGRGEQILRTDQDNGVIYSGNINKELVKQASEKFNSILIELGYPECSGGVMAKNAYYQKSVESYKKDIYEMVMSPTPESFLNLPILMDMKFVSGNKDMADEVAAYLTKKLSMNPQILARMAGGSLSFDTPLSLLGGFVLDKKEHKDELDIKKGAIFPIVNSIRCLSFEKNINSVGTFERIKELNNSGLIDRAFAEELIEAYNFLLEIRLKERLYKINIGQQPDNYINPQRLSKLERDLLKDVFKIVDKLKKFLFAHFKLGYLS
ncbi:MAG: putative nucleotidyltransferase substrate binding domain-containing protein [Campylobacterales bacterium]|nr:putative nucleotidyltransferase substrate binding domain-containing protein [Campylobacterales bacterium]